jgi:hypothetical protein
MGKPQAKEPSSGDGIELSVSGAHVRQRLPAGATVCDEFSSCREEMGLVFIVPALAHRPSRFLMRAKAPGGIHLPPRAFEVYDDFEAMLCGVKPVALHRGNFELIDTGAKVEATPVGYDIIAVANFNLGLTVAPAFQANAHFPRADALSLQDGVRRDIKI